MLSALVLSAVLAFGVDPEAQVDFQRLPTPRDAVAYAVNDLQGVHPNDQKFQRYLWLQNPTRERVGLLSFVLNQNVGHAARYRPTVLYRGALVRVDLRYLAPKEQDFNRLRDLWEEMAAGNFYFHTIRNVITEITPSPVLVSVPKYQHTDGRWYTKKWETPQPVRKEALAVEFALHTDMEKALLLHALTGESKNPIMLGEQFILQASMTTRHTNFEGLYYRFRGIKQDAEPGRRDVDVWLERFGSSWDQVEKLDSDSRAGMTISGVTDKPRRLDFFYGTNVRPSDGTPLITLSHDIAKGNNDPFVHPIRSLLADKWDAIEAIATTQNGLHEYAIFDEDGRLAISVPDTIAHDTDIPGSAEQILEPGISCTICHAKEDGYRSFRNNVKELLQNNFLPVDDDTSKLDPLATADSLRGKYGGDLDFRILDARRDLARATYIVSGGMSPKEIGDELQKVRVEYLYTPLTPKSLVASLGFQVESDEKAVTLLNQVCPLPPANRFGYHMEDPMLALMRIWKPEAPQRMKRLDWELLFSDTMLRTKTKLTLDQVHNSQGESHANPHSGGRATTYGPKPPR